MEEERGHARANEDAHAILTRMLADAERLCSTPDSLLTGQAAQLRGRIAAMVEITTPPASLGPEARP